MASNKINKSTKIKVTADIKDANKSLRTLQNKVSKLGDLSDHGNSSQRGFLSSKQVQMYKSILKQMQQEYEKHQKRLQQIEEQYNKKKIKANSISDKRLQDLADAERRGVVAGNPLTEKVNKYYQDKYQQAKQNAERIERDPETLGTIEGLKESVKQLGEELNKAQPHIASINNMHVQDGGARDVTNGALQVLGQAGTVFSLSRLLGYTSTGAKMLRQDEYSSARLGQKLGYDGGTDADLRNRAAKLGEKNQYSVNETLDTETQLARGGYKDVKALGTDTQAIQQFSRAYAVDTSEVAESGALLKRMGTLKDGDMQKFANMIAGSISKTGMSGREEEVLRATTNVLSQVGDKMVGLDDNQASNVVGLQTTIGEAVPLLNGERGGQLLSTMDSSIKNGDNAFDILMGKGTKYVGIEGQYQLEMQKEQGLANPQNLQDFFQGVDRTGATGTEKAYMAKKLGLSLSEEKVLRETGLIDKFKKGDFNVTDKEKKQLQQAGATKILEGINSWDTTQSKKQTSNDAQGYNLQESTSKPYDRTAKGALGLWNKLPNMLQGGLIWGAGIGGTKMIKPLIRKYGGKLTDWATKTFTNTVGKGGGFKSAEDLSSMFSGLFKSGASEGSTVASRSKNLFPKIAQKGSSILDGISSAGSTMISNGGKFSKFGGKLLKGLGTAGKSAGKLLPVAGVALDVGIDRLQNPNSNWGRSLAKGAGSFIGGALGLGGAVLAGIPTGGAGTIATAGLAIGGSMAGDKIGDKVYSAIFGDDDLKRVDEQKVQQMVDPVQADNTSVTTSPSKVATLNVDKVNIDGVPIDKLSSIKSVTTGNKGVNQDSKSYNSFSGVDSAIANVGQDHNINITISGSIDGMNKTNQTEVKESITGFWSKLLGSTQQNSINLAYAFRNK